MGSQVISSAFGRKPKLLLRAYPGTRGNRRFVDPFRTSRIGNAAEGGLVSRGRPIRSFW